ncbi:MAG: hypothetical protein VB093_14605, partial [Propionicimonas sp.]|nr:hypothetical protein [Propionicimonas sp.]
ESRFADRYLKRMKTIERNRARLGETQLWAGLLRGELEPTLFETVPDRVLQFGNLVEFKLGRGLSDTDWAGSGAGKSEASEPPDDEVESVPTYEDFLQLDAVSDGGEDDE